MQKNNKYFLMASVALCLCFISVDSAARSAAYQAPAQAQAQPVATSAGETTGVWDKTKEVGSDVWKGTKDVTGDVWDGTKKVGSDVWDGAKKIGGDISDAVSGADDAPTSVPPAAPNAD